MKLALLGLDEHMRAVAQAAVQAGHEIACVVAPQAAPSPWAGLAHQAAMLDTADAVLGLADAALVAPGPEDATLSALRPLVQAEMPLLVSHPLFESVLAYYELDAVRQESQSPVIPFLAARWHPAIEALLALCAAGGLGALRQVALERRLAEPSRRTVSRLLAIDADLLQRLSGPLTKVGALAPPGEATRYDALGVQLSGPSGTLVRWSVEADPQPGAVLRVAGTSGRAVLAMPPGDQPWVLELTQGDAPTTAQSYPTDRVARRAVETLQRAVDGDAVEPTWSDAIHSAQVVEALHRSLGRGRVVDIRYEEPDEEATFKGLMTSLGCLVLLGSLVLLLAAGGAAAADLIPRQAVALVPLAALGVFLMLQLLRLVVPPRDGPGAPQRPPAENAEEQSAPPDARSA
jgi:predicted dehydrogenase